MGKSSKRHAACIRVEVVVIIAPLLSHRKVNLSSSMHIGCDGIKNYFKDFEPVISNYLGNAVNCIRVMFELMRP